MTAWQILGVWLSGWVLGLVLGVVGMMRAPNKNQSYVALEQQDEVSGYWRSVCVVGLGFTVADAALGARGAGVYLNGYYRLRESEHFSVR